MEAPANPIAEPFFANLVVLPDSFYTFTSNNDGKSCISIRKSISTSEQRAEHPLAGRSTQHVIVP